MSDCGAPSRTPQDMSRKIPKNSPLPSRENVLAYLSGEASPSGAKPSTRVTKRELARAFRVKGEAKGELKTLIRDLESEGAVRRGRKVLSRQGRLPAMLVADIVERGPDGAFVATPVENGGQTRILIRPSKRDRAPAATLGARALLRVAHDEASGTYSGRIVKILDRGAGRPLGVFFALESGGGRVQPIEKRAAGREYFVSAGLENGARDGELVALAPLRERNSGAPAARVLERLGPVDTERAISRIAIAAHGLPDAFSAAALNEAEDARPATTGASRGLARPAARHHRPARRQGPRRRRPRGRPIPTRKRGRLRRHCRHRRRRLLRQSRARRSTARRWSAAIRSISPTASCRCCPSASPTTFARCARARTGRRSRCA